MLSLNLFILICSVSANAALGVLVLHRRPHTRSAKIFGILVGLVIIWSLVNYLIDTSSTTAEALIWTRILFSLALTYIWTFVCFARAFSEIAPARLPWLMPSVTIFTFLAILVTLNTDLVFMRAHLESTGLDNLAFGDWYLPLSIVSLGTVGIGVAELVRKARRAGRTVLRDQAVVIIIGWVIFLSLVIIFAAILPFFIPALVDGSKIAPLFSIIMVASTTYSIVRHKFLDTTLIIRRGLVYSLSFGTILGIYISLLLAFKQIMHQDSDSAEFLVSAITIIFGIFSAPKIERYFKRQTNRFFFKDTYDYSAVLEELSSIANSTLQAPYLIKESLHVLTRVLKPERIEFIRKDFSSHRSDELVLPENGLRIPVSSSNGLLGEFLIWKRSGDAYVPEDRTLLRTFASHVSVALEKADLYSELEEHSRVLEEKVRDRTVHLETLRASQRAFMDDISHALQTPLTVLGSAVEGITEALPASKSRHRDLMTRSIEDLTRLIRNLLSLARVDAIPAEEIETTISLSDLVTRVAEYVEIICDQNDIRLTKNIEQDVTMYGSQMQLEEALTNILSNAVRYTKDAPERRIEIMLVREPKKILLSVTDSGIGIDSDRLPYVFERFYRAQDREGSGLGLAITKRIVERHQGTVTATSTLGIGTKIEFCFPI
jgi:signal transduction histidine kinase